MAQDGVGVGEGEGVEAVFGGQRLEGGREGALEGLGRGVGEGAAGELGGLAQGVGAEAGDGDEAAGVEDRVAALGEGGEVAQPLDGGGGGDEVEGSGPGEGARVAAEEGGARHVGKADLHIRAEVVEDEFARGEAGHQLAREHSRAAADFQDARGEEVAVRAEQLGQALGLLALDGGFALVGGHRAGKAVDEQRGLNHGSSPRRSLAKSSGAQWAPGTRRADGKAASCASTGKMRSDSAAKARSQVKSPAPRCI